MYARVWVGEHVDASGVGKEVGASRVGKHVGASRAGRLAYRPASGRPAGLRPAGLLAGLRPASRPPAGRLWPANVYLQNISPLLIKFARRARLSGGKKKGTC